MAEDLEWLRLALRLASPVFDRATIDTLICYGVRRRRDEPNALGGLKQHVDALVRAGWVLDDDTGHLRFTMPALRVERPARVEFTLWPSERSDT